MVLAVPKPLLPKAGFGADEPNADEPNAEGAAGDVVAPKAEGAD